MIGRRRRLLGRRSDGPGLPGIRRWFAASALASAVVAAVVTVGSVVGPAGSAAADSAPADPGDPTTPATVAADALPTAQINGVAWSQVVVAGTVYVAGQFTNARPAGAAAGSSTVTRSNLLAYDLATGVLVNSWAPSLNGAAYAIAASPDGSRLYVGGAFTTVNGASQTRFVVLNRATGARISGINPAPNGSVRAIAASASTVYLGGAFGTVAGSSRPRLAALSASTGALLSWRVSASAAQVDALVLSPDSSRLIVGGRFETLNGVAALGSGSVSASTGAVLPWAANKVVTNYGYDAGIESLATDGTLIYGTGFAYLGHNGGYGNLEGTFAADPTTGAIVWVEDCHGDTYSVYGNPGKGSVYVVGHPHYCANIGGFGDSSWKFALAFSKEAATTITPNTVAKYYDWQGLRAPALLAFSPELTGGEFTGTGQAAWHVTGSGDYVVYGGEFLTVNGTPQQGLVRMAVSGSSTNKQGPRLSGTALNLAVTSRAAGTAQVSWPTNWDRDNGTLTYAVLRDGATTPVYTTTADSTWWSLSRASFTDTGLVAGRTYTYRVRASDPFGNSQTSGVASVTVAGSSAGAMSTYAQEVLLDNPAAYWRLGESSGAALDWTAYASSTVGSGVTRAVTGAIAGDANRAARFSGASSSRVYGARSAAGTNRLSVEAWIRTTSTAGGKIVGFGNSSTGNSSTYDRHVYLNPNGRLTFGVYPNAVRAITTPSSYNDGQWHHVVATLGTAGMRLYVDGVLAAERTDTTSAGQYTGYWRIGGDTLAADWPGAGGQNFAGDVDDVAIYGRALAPSEVATHYSTGSGGVVPNQPPVASFGATPTGLSVAVDGAASSDPDGTVTAYSWEFGDGGTGTGAAATHEYAAEGTYPVTLTVTDDDGSTGSVTQDVTVSEVAQPPEVLAADAFGRTVAAGWGSADAGGAWTAPSATASVSDGVGRLTLAGASSTVTSRLPGASGTRLATQATETWDKRPAGAGGWFLVRGRITATGEEYRLKIAHKANGAVTARLARTTSAGVETQLTGEVTVPGLTYSAGSGVVVLFEVTGTSPTALRAKVWAATGSQPAAWVVSATDATAALQTSGHTGIAALTSSTTTNGPVTTTMDDYTVTTIP
ncbi:LamG-like jellyroll fold domain-containing protein [Pengzhenrongella sicca]|uniref:PKD domain-containing protein n=1 Tax=Pengzhenrongella sicca TaxID=2819238 RepID=A0A8A4ZBW7_9MICO|nr:LamG-like jellyroll fold domain-containing protein [Pengzhenrongella sicca]QTE28895.1 PKD domain-containing protein [Pengzhenrongella sicca]